jgi:carbamoyltransferase
MIQLGISAFYHDAAACIVKNGKVLRAVEEERFTGVKHDQSFPINSINWMLADLNLTIEDIDQVCWYEDPALKKDRVISIFNQFFFKSLWNRFKFLKRHSIEGNIPQLLKHELGYNGEIKYTNHHESHAAFSYFTSSYNHAAVVSIDGVGEWATTTIYRGDGAQLTKILQVNFPHSIGMLYSTITAFLGFQPNEGEYKVMGLAPYGDPTKYQHLLLNLINFRPNGKFEIDQTHFTWGYSDTIMFKESLCEYLQLPVRLKGEEITQDHKDLAVALQKTYETVFLHILKAAKQITGYDNVCLSGGCAYNGVANNRAYEVFNSVWVPFAPSDSGSCIGACLANYHGPRCNNTTPYLGPVFDDDDAKSALKAWEDQIEWTEHEEAELISKTAKAINAGHVIGWFQGRMEFGARALGNRSILASPLGETTKARLNQVIKKREGFRPFAPSCVESEADKFFEIKDTVPYMNQVMQVRSKWKMPAITHADGSARVQTVNKKQNEKYHALLTELGKISGYPISLNTSFNFKDQTITMTPFQAIERFLDCDMDVLVINNFYIVKRSETYSL